VAAYVRIRNLVVFRAHVQAYGSQVRLAARCGLSDQRVSQLMTSKGPVIRAIHAAALETELGVPRGYLFIADEPELIRDYLGEIPLVVEEDDVASTDRADSADPTPAEE